MTGRKLQTRITALGVFILPVVLVKVTGALVGGGPDGAAATPGDDAAAAPTASAAQPLVLSERQHAAAERIESLSAAGFGRNPLLYRAAAAMDQPASAAPLEIEPARRPDLRAIVAAGGPAGASALVNGSWRREGDPVPGGWTIVRIDAMQRTVTFRSDASHETISISIASPR
jgi:hypothetical protein